MIIDDVFRAHLIFNPLKSLESEEDDVDGIYTAQRGETFNGTGNVGCLSGCLGNGVGMWWVDVYMHMSLQWFYKMTLNIWIYHLQKSE